MVLSWVISVSVFLVVYRWTNDRLAKIHSWVSPYWSRPWAQEGCGVLLGWQELCFSSPGYWKSSSDHSLEDPTGSWCWYHCEQWLLGLRPSFGPHPTFSCKHVPSHGIAFILKFLEFARLSLSDTLNMDLPQLMSTSPWVVVSKSLQLAVLLLSMFLVW